MIKRFIFIAISSLLLTSCGSSKQKCNAYGDLNEEVEESYQNT